MKPSFCLPALLLLLLLLLHHPILLISARPHVRASQSSRHAANPWLGRKKRKGADTLQVAGSRLPDCSHACGSCSPCRLVMVSFVCASLHEAETCPMAYKCMCHNKSYPVP